MINFKVIDTTTLIILILSVEAIRSIEDIYWNEIQNIMYWPGDELVTISGIVTIKNFINHYQYNIILTYHLS